ncbi:B12-binding domain-containing radical SAM protein [Acidobacteriota bacterium]
MKVLLINPSIAQSEVYAKYSAGAPCLPPLGLCYLAAVLEQNGHEVRIVDCVAERLFPSDLNPRIEEFRPEVVGVTSTTVSYEAAKKVLEVVKGTDGGVTTILGGAHMSSLPRETMEECGHVDIGVFGEGEYTLLEILERLVQRQPVEGLAGTIVRAGPGLQEGEPRGPHKNLDDIPFPARHLLKDLRMYSHTPFRGAKFMTTMVTSRGCVFDCGFCDQSVFGRGWRYHSTGYVISEISHLQKVYGIDFISFEDDNFMISKKRTHDICEQMISRDFKISWSCLGHVNELDDEVLPLMKKAGCRTIYLGIESGSPRVLEIVNKKTRVEDIRKGVERIKRHGISITGSFILGLPTETREEMQKTIELALSLPLDGVSFFTFTPYPRTRLRELALQNGAVSKSWRDYSGHPSSLPFIPDGFEAQEILDIQSQAYRRFLLRPGYIVRHAGTFANAKALSKGIKFLKALITK